MLFLEDLKPEIKFFISPSRPATLNDAIQTAQLYDSSYRQVNQLNSQTTTTPNLFNIPIMPNQIVQNPLAKQIEELTTKLNQLTTKNNNNQNNRQNNNQNLSNNRPARIPCIYCGRNNHLSVDCYIRNERNNNNNNNNNNNSKPITCYKCDKMGHTAIRCLSKNNNQYNNNNNNNNNNYNNNNNNNYHNNNNNYRPNNQKQNNFLNTEEHLND